VERATVRSADQRDRQVAPDDLPVRVKVALAEPVGVDLAGQCLVEQLEVGIEVLVVGELLEAPRDQLVLVVAEHLAQGPVDHQQVTIEADQGHADGRVLEREAPQLPTVR